MCLIEWEENGGQIIGFERPAESARERAQEQASGLMKGVGVCRRDDNAKEAA